MIPEQTEEQYVAGLEQHLRKLQARHSVVKKRDRRGEEEAEEDERKDAPLLCEQRNGEDESVHDFGSEFDETVQEEWEEEWKQEESDEAGCCC